MTEPDAPAITESMTAPDAARAAEEALRQAAHASWSGVSTAADVYTVFGAVGYSVELVPQLLEQLTSWLEAHHGSFGISDPPGTDATGDAAERVAAVRAAVAAAARSLDTAREQLAAAQAALAPLYGPVSAARD